MSTTTNGHLSKPPVEVRVIRPGRLARLFCVPVAQMLLAIFIDPHSARVWQWKLGRMAIGGRWALWEMDNCGSGKQLLMWWPSPCDHYPRPIAAVADYPQRVEEYL